MREESKRNALSGLVALILMGTFAAAILGVVIAGAEVYQNMLQRDRVTYEQRTRAQYILTKVRQASSPAAVSIESFGKADALVIREYAGDEAYLTRVYCHEGDLMELFAPEQGDFAPGDGEEILPAQGMTLARDGNLLLVTFLADEEEESLSVYLPRREGDNG